MHYILIFVASFFLFVNSSIAQVNFYRIPFEKTNSNIMLVDVLINGIPRKFVFDTGASTVSFGSDFLNTLIQNKVISVDDIKEQTKVNIANGQVTNATKIKLKSLEVGNLKLNDIDALVIDENNVPFLLGQNIFNSFGSITIDNHRKEIYIGGSPPASLMEIKELRIIPCSYTVKKQIKNIKKIISQPSVLNIQTLTEELKIPPYNAQSRIKTAYVIRFFDRGDKPVALKLKNLLEAEGFSSLEVSIEDMTPFFKNNIPGYLELWMKD